MTAAQSWHDRKPTKLNVGGRVFCIDPAVLSSSSSFFLHRASEPSENNGGFCLDQDSSGCFVIDRDADLFESIVYPLLTRGVAHYHGMDPHVVLQELSYFGLTTPLPNALSTEEANLLCRLLIDRTLDLNYQCTQLLLFAEDLQVCPFNIHVDVQILITFLAKRLKTIAMTEYGIALQWAVFDTEVSYDVASKMFRTTRSQEAIQAYTVYSRPSELAQWTVAADPAVMKSCGIEYVQHTGKHYIMHPVKAKIESEDITVKVVMNYDLFRSRTVVAIDCQKTDKTLDTMPAFAIVLLFANKDEHPIPTPHTLDDLSRCTPWEPVLGSRLAMRVAQGNVETCHRLVDPAIFSILVYLVRTDKKVDYIHTTPKQYLHPNLKMNRVVPQTRQRRLCRMQLLAVRP